MKVAMFFETFSTAGEPPVALYYSTQVQTIYNKFIGKKVTKGN
jgi:hypothetical protein